VITVEENVLAGGFGSAVVETLLDLGISADVRRIGLPDRFIPHATQVEQRQEVGLSEDALLEAFREHVEGARGQVVTMPVSLAS
jgi:1-deoxy-D-xylulose-5-phosphate synthase